MRKTILFILALMTATFLEASEEKRQLLANHETLAVFDGIEYHLCRGLTALCPDKCGHSGEFANFKVKKYLKYEKLGEYGDPEQKTFSVQISDFHKKPKGDPKILETVKGLKNGDYVLLSWHHDYVTKDGASGPERPIVKLEAVAKEKAEGLLSDPAPKDDTAKVTGSLIVPKGLDSFDGRVVEIELYKYDPRIADKAADLVEKVEIKDFSHAKGTETKKEFVIGATATLEKDRSYYLVAIVLKDGQRTHWGEVPGKDLCKVLTNGEPRNVTLVFRPVR